MKHSKGTVKNLIAVVFSALVLAMAAHHVYRGATATPMEWSLIGKGVLFIFGALLILGCRFFQDRLTKCVGRRNRKTVSEHLGNRSDRKPGEMPEIFKEIINNLPREGEAFTVSGNVKLTKDELEEFARRREEDNQWTPENPKPQTFDFDDGTCPYKRDPTRPLGTRENPVVVGVPSASNHLAFSPERHCWILTDGLGNGLIR